MHQHAQEGGCDNVLDALCAIYVEGDYSTHRHSSSKPEGEPKAEEHEESGYVISQTFFV